MIRSSIRATALSSLFLTSLATAESLAPPYYQNAEFIVVWRGNGEGPSPRKLCQTLMETNPDLGRPQCREGGDWERDPERARYAQWLAINMDSRTTPELLKARHPAVLEALSKTQDDYLIIAAGNQDSAFASLFHGGGGEPAQVVSLDPQSPEATLAKLFRGKTKPIPTEKERLAAKTDPDASFSSRPPFDWYAGVGLGWTQAALPFTPDNRSSRIRGNSVRLWRDVPDSLSAWNILDDQAMTQEIHAGFVWERFLGLELFYQQSSHDVKLYPGDSSYAELNQWKYTLAKLGLLANIQHTFTPSPILELSPRLLMGFHYTFPIEDFSYDGVSSEAEERIELESLLKGAVFALSLRAVALGRWGVECRTGVDYFGLSRKADPEQDPAEIPTIVGGLTYAWFASASIEYNWRSRTKE